RDANPPLPTHAQLYKALTDWVEKGIVPGRIDITTQPTPESPAVKSRPLCPYPQKATYKSGDPNLAASYICS
ncbi:MAG: tannase/feruloyl esterase family alpha/beta hydrolase, partial [Gammaproteobacteria bacterium]|nr:tannase/feruloyl esterase family alpha/beta hydrolase [Gammaproteobacteria bacterium]